MPDTSSTPKPPLALLVIGHPSPGSFSHAMAEAARQVLAEAGYTCAWHDLYAERFNPVQPVPESGNTASDDPLVETHCRELAAADLIAVFHPNWWSQPPAIVKGWIDRVFRLDTAYAYPQDVGFEGVPVGLLRARHALVFNTSNTRPWGRPGGVGTRCGSRHRRPSCAAWVWRRARRPQRCPGGSRTAWSRAAAARAP